jgi:hypothetical protein
MAQTQNQVNSILEEVKTLTDSIEYQFTMYTNHVHKRKSADVQITRRAYERLEESISKLKDLSYIN